MLLTIGVLFGFVALAVYMWYGREDDLEDEYLPYDDGYDAVDAQRADGPPTSAANADLPVVYLYFGSQTGTAEEFAETVAKDAPRAYFRTEVVDLEDFDPLQFRKQKYAMFFVATYGEGDPTDNAMDFAKWLRTASPKDSGIEGLKFAVFGLGNSQYEHFNAMGRLVDARLEALGAERMRERGEGDDDGTLEEDFDAWRATLWGDVCADQLGVEIGDEDADGRPVERVDFDLKAVLLSGRRAVADGRWTPAKEQMSRAGKAHFAAREARCVVARELRPSTRDGGSTLHVEIELGEEESPAYQTADNLAILPENSRVQVESVARTLGLDLEATFKLVPKPGRPGAKHIFPTPCTVREALTRYVDLNGPPKQRFLRSLSAYAEGAGDRARLARLAKDKVRFREEVVEPMLTIAEAIAQHVSLTMSLEDCMQLLPPMQERLYTVSSSARAFPSRCHVTAVAETRRGLPAAGSCFTDPLLRDRTFHGACTGYLERLRRALDTSPDGVHAADGVDLTRVRCLVRASTFRAPRDPMIPMIMIGPGTGLAPMRALLQDRELLVQERGVGSVGDTVLFYGCKMRDLDYIYRDELAQFQASGALTTLLVAFSREQAEKIYVQHLLLRERAMVWDLLDARGAHVYVCGGAAMGRDVLQAILKVIAEGGGLNESDARRYVAGLEASGRYVAELWS